MDWSRGPTVGRGSFATVSAAISNLTGHIFAVKSTQLSSSNSLQNEQRILSNLTHPRIIGYIGHDTTVENHKFLYNLFLEFLPYGNLNDETLRHGGTMKDSLIALYTRQILDGLDHIHSIGIAHCDIKGQNILLGENGAKIADFGCAKWVSYPPPPENVISGTPTFMAPEVAGGEEQGFPADIWALGCTIIEMATGGSPWSSHHRHYRHPCSILYRIAFSGESPIIPDFLSGKAKDFLGRCLRRDPKERWTARELLKHPFVEESNYAERENEGLNSKSPMSTLNQSIWNSVEDVSEVPRPSSGFSQGDRIRQLTSFSGKPNWSREENWVTIRDYNYYKTHQLN
ncbi:mitogen-activated protein kinase kinase kinase 18-like [Impatiens glandulifera]|uniref:mitogen-activated protein kinase kinase kinase 18-like n=1 Tax=Impatiens glandulifera TaxID=253017 RepID=UPI001FB19D65|nr:mitogen-activated protein kinase kinase kinase 18-like [Impatiens glandulifera]